MKYFRGILKEESYTRIVRGIRLQNFTLEIAPRRYDGTNSRSLLCINFYTRFHAYFSKQRLSFFPFCKQIADKNTIELLNRRKKKPIVILHSIIFILFNIFAAICRKTFLISLRFFSSSFFLPFFLFLFRYIKKIVFSGEKSRLESRITVISRGKKNNIFVVACNKHAGSVGISEKSNHFFRSVTNDTEFTPYAASFYGSGVISPYFFIKFIRSLQHLYTYIHIYRER